MQGARAMTVSTRKFTELDHLYADAYQNLHQIKSMLSEMPQNQGFEARIALQAILDNSTKSIEAFREFDR